MDGGGETRAKKRGNRGKNDDETKRKRIWGWEEEGKRRGNQKKEKKRGKDDGLAILYKFND